MKIIDISKHNGNLDFNKIKASGIEGVMIRIGYGIRHEDPMFRKNVEGCIAAGLHYGFYFYSYALNVNEANEEANYCLELLKGYAPTLPIAFDMEDADGYKRKYGMPSNSTLQAICETFLSVVQKEGYYVSLYASLSWLNNQLNTPSLDIYDKWVAQWNSKCTYNKPYGMWQYTDAASIPGSSIRTDANLAYKDYPNIIKENKLNKTENYVQPPVSSNPSMYIKVGDRVSITGNIYATGEKIPGWVKKSTYIVQQVDGNRVLLKEIMSWINISDIKVNSNTQSNSNSNIGIVDCDVLNVRSGAGTNYGIIGKLYKGDTVKIASKVGDWYSLWYGDHGGFVYCKYIK